MSPDEKDVTLPTVMILLFIMLLFTFFIYMCCFITLHYVPSNSSTANVSLLCAFSHCVSHVWISFVINGSLLHASYTVE